MQMEKILTEKMRPNSCSVMNPKEAYLDARSKNARVPALERIIAKDPETSYLYATNVCKGVFKEGESSIKSHPIFSYMYCKYVIKGAWYEAEDAIKKDPHCAYSYCKMFLKERWVEAERHIKKSPFWATSYAIEILKSRFKEAEPHIAKNRDAAEDYAKNVVKGEWSDWTDEELKRSTVWMYFYASSLGHMLPVGIHEFMISKRDLFSEKYVKKFCD